jgi:DNA-binding IclR family transcriptional regulator
MRRREAPVVRIQVLERAFRALEILAASNEGMYLTDLATAMRLPATTLHNIMTTLLALGYAEQDSSSRYYCGHRFSQLRHRAGSESDLFDVARREMMRLAEETGETCHLTWLIDTQMVILATREAKHRLVVKPALPLSFHASATGKAFLCEMSKDEIDRMLAVKPLIRYCDNTITTREALYAELERTRIRGYALNRGEEHPDIHGVAVSIRHGDRRVVLTVEIASNRSSEEKLATVARLAKAAVVRARQDLGILHEEESCEINVGRSGG